MPHSGEQRRVKRWRSLQTALVQSHRNSPPTEMAMLTAKNSGQGRLTMGTGEIITEIKPTQFVPVAFNQHGATFMAIGAAVFTVENIPSVNIMQAVAQCYFT